MEEIRKSYQAYKKELDCELNRAAEGFVKIGYLLKIARDTEVLYESGYHSVAEFAQAEYGLSKDIVSRYIAINDKYSEGGYSEHLQERYTGFGVGKLQEMLTLPEAVANILTPDMTKREIQEIKAEVREEEEVTDIEVMLEKPDTGMEEMTVLQKVIHLHFQKDKEGFLALDNALRQPFMKEEYLLDILAPKGIAVLTERIPGRGKMMLSIKGTDQDIDLVDIRANTTESYTWQQLSEAILQTFDGFEEADWEEHYKEPFKEEVAPVQPEASQTPGQVPGQMQVEDYPELLPDDTQKTEENSQPEMTESMIKKECDTDSEEEMENTGENRENSQPKNAESMIKKECDTDSGQEMEKVEEIAEENEETPIKKESESDFEWTKDRISHLAAEIASCRETLKEQNRLSQFEYTTLLTAGTRLLIIAERMEG